MGGAGAVRSSSVSKGGGANGEEVAIDTLGGFSWEGWHWEEDQG